VSKNLIVYAKGFNSSYAWLSSTTCRSTSVQKCPFHSLQGRLKYRNKSSLGLTLQFRNCWIRCFRKQKPRGSARLLSSIRHENINNVEHNSVLWQIWQVGICLHVFFQKILGEKACGRKTLAITSGSVIHKLRSTFYIYVFFFSGTFERHKNSA